MDNMLNNISVREFLGPISQLITNLLGKNGAQWWEAFKCFLRKEMVVFHHDIAFGCFAGYGNTSKPHTISFDKKMQPHEVRIELGLKGLRMATVEEQSAFMAETPKGEENLSTMVFSSFGLGPRQRPCAILFSKTPWGKLKISVVDNGNTAVWSAGVKFLVVPNY